MAKENMIELELNISSDLPIEHIEEFSSSLMRECTEWPGLSGLSKPELNDHEPGTRGGIIEIGILIIELFPSYFEFFMVHLSNYLSEKEAREQVSIKVGDVSVSFPKDTDPKVLKDWCKAISTTIAKK